MLHYTLNIAREEVKIQNITAITGEKTNVTNISTLSINKNRYLVYMGTSFGPATISSFSKAEDSHVVIYSFNENYGCMKSLCLHNNALTFSYGGLKARLSCIKSSSNRLETTCNLNSVLEEIKDLNVYFHKFLICNVTQKLKLDFEKEFINLNLKTDILLFFSTTEETYVLKMDIENYHLEAIQILNF